MVLMLSKKMLFLFIKLKFYCHIYERVYTYEWSVCYYYYYYCFCILDIWSIFKRILFFKSKYSVCVLLAVFIFNIFDASITYSNIKNKRNTSQLYILLILFTDFHSNKIHRVEHRIQYTLYMHDIEQSIKHKSSVQWPKEHTILMT